MRLILYTVVSCLVTMVMVPMITTAQDTSNALVAVEVEDENDTSIEVIVNKEKPVQSEESFLDPNAERFVPTKEWQHVKPDQSVPSGLHIRLNLETGTREAKLMEGDDGSRFQMKEDGTEPQRLKVLKKKFEKSMKNVDTSDDEGMQYWQKDGKQGILNMKKDSFSRAELKEALKKFKASDDDDIQVKKKKKDFRSASELKEELKSLNLGIKTDHEIMEGLLRRYKTGLPAEEKETVLEDLEFLVHQIDNGKYLVDSGGIELIINDMNQSNPIISGSAAYVIGSAVQSNPYVQVAALKAGALSQLIRTLSVTTDTKIQHKFLYALSTLVRHFPYAQQKLVESGGLQTLTSLLTMADDVKIKIKVVTLVADLVQERKYAIEQEKLEQSESLKEKLQQYEKVQMERLLQLKGWCDLIPPLLSLQEHDIREKILIAMDTLNDDCDSFSYYQPQLKLLKEEYTLRATAEAKENESDTYFGDLLRKIESLLTKIEDYMEYTRHTDL